MAKVLVHIQENKHWMLNCAGLLLSFSDAAADVKQTEVYLYESSVNWDINLLRFFSYKTIKMHICHHPTNICTIFSNKITFPVNSSF